MNVNALFLAASLPLILGVPSFDLPGYVPQMTGIESPLLVCENGHLIDGTNMYEFDITNASGTYVNASSLTIDDIESQIVLLDTNTVLAPNEKRSVTFLLGQDETVLENISNHSIFGEGYISKPAKCEFEEVQWISCEKIESTISEAYKYTFNMNPFNYTGTEDILYTVETSEGNYSFYGGDIHSEYYSFVLDKEINMDNMKVTNMQSLQMVNVGAGRPDNYDDSRVGLALIWTLSLPVILMGIAVLGGVALLLTVIIIIIRSIVKKTKAKQAA